MLRLDGQYGTGAIVADLAGFLFVMRGKDYAVLNRGRPSRLACICPPISTSVVPPSQITRALYDCPDVPVGPAGERCRVVVATR